MEQNSWDETDEAPEATQESGNTDWQEETRPFESSDDDAGDARED